MLSVNSFEFFFFPSCSPVRGHVMLRDFLFLTGVTMETRRAQGEKVQVCQTNRWLRTLIPTIRPFVQAHRVDHGEGHMGTLCRYARSQLIWLTHTHTAGDKRVPLPKQLNATNTAAGSFGVTHLWPFLSGKTCKHTCVRSHIRAPPLLHVQDSCNDRELSSELGDTLPELYFKRSSAMDLMSIVIG